MCLFKQDRNLKTVSQVFGEKGACLKADEESRGRWRVETKDRTWHRKCFAAWQVVETLGAYYKTSHANSYNQQAAAALEQYRKRKGWSLNKFKLECLKFASAKVKVAGRLVARSSVVLPAEIRALATEVAAAGAGAAAQ